MNNQYSQSLPCFTIDRENRKSGFDTSRDFPGELEKFYSKFIEGDLDYFGLDTEHSAGFHYFIESMPDHKSDDILALKGQITGPLTLGLMTDYDGKYAMYKPDLFDAIIKDCIMSARWQVRKLRELCGNVIIFFDEPSLQVIGSGFYSVDNELVTGSFNEIARGIQAEGGIAGTHCCGNANWEEILNLDIDIVNFDASDDEVTDKFLSAGNIGEFLEKGKIIAWGVVPTLADKIELADIEKAEKGFRGILKRLTELGLREDDVLRQSILTPSCGTGTLSVELAEKAISLTSELSLRIRG
jgi:methionine synthase II (cobalamin-independent)